MRQGHDISWRGWKTGACLLLACLTGCGEPAQPPAPPANAEAPPQAVSSPPVQLAEATEEAVDEALQDEAELPAPARVSEEEDADEAVESLQSYAESQLASARRIPVRRALNQLLKAREASEDAAWLEELSERAARMLIEWDSLALSHDATGLAERDLPLLQRWKNDDPQVQALATKLARVQQIVSSLARADARIRQGRLLGQGSDHAVAHLQAALRLDPAHRGAIQRLENIEAGLLEKALSAAQEGHFTQADALLADAGNVRGGSMRVQDAAARVVEVRERHVRMWRSRIDDALAVNDVAGAEAHLPMLDAISLDERDGAAARASIERVRRYGAYDAGMLLVDPLASGGMGPGMVVVPVGRFAMGSARSENGHQSNEGPQHAVRFERGFALARTETTVAQFRSFVEATGYRTTARVSRRSMVYDERSGALVEQRRVRWSDDYTGRPAPDDAPVLHVSWDDARAYAQWLAKETGAPYRLPSEAEFEYALRAGSTSQYPWGDGSPPSALENLTGARDTSPTGRQWRNAFSQYGDGHWGPAAVGSLASNPFGLNDMNGNVSEWVEDCWHDTYARAPRNGSAWVNPGCTQRVIRGGSWASSPEQARSAFRIRAPADTVSARVGFRVARDL